VGTRQQLVGQLTDQRASVDALLLGAIVPLLTPLLVALAFAFVG
jgi:hypothetical protein